MAGNTIEIRQPCDIYELPRLMSPKLGELEPGTVLDRVEDANKEYWFAVVYQGTQGYVLKEAAAPSEQIEARDAHDKQTGSGVSIQRRYPALQTISGFFRLFGWITIGLGSVGTILSAIAIGSANDGSGVAAAAILIGGLIGSVASGVIFIALADLLLVAIDIERNTRSSAANDD
ncbi:MAG: hypothetical protein IID41_10495 [Planctomycetes bacterium]|nr:hypothetical protein [Planctomycetota bacterium]